MTTPDRCVLNERHDRQIGLICWSCRDRLTLHLDPRNYGRPFNPDRPSDPVRPPSIPVLYRDLADLDPPGNERPGEHAAAASLDPHPMVMRDVRSKANGVHPDDDHLAAPRSVVAALGGWARIVHEEHLDLDGRPDPLPSLAAPAWLESTVPVPTADPGVLAPWRKVRAPRTVPRPDVQAVETLCSWLHRRVDWIAGQPWVDEFAAELRLLTAQLRAGTGDPGARPLGPCRAWVDDDGVLDGEGEWQCWEPLHLPAAPPRGPDEPAVVEVRCPACGTRWVGLKLLELARERGVEMAG